MSQKNFVTELFGLDNKVAAIIGGGGVLGGAMAEGLAKAGAKIAILDFSIENAEKTAQSIGDTHNCETMAIQCDASNKQSLAAANSEIIEQWGQVDVLINAPGINSSTPFFEIEETEWQRILDVNLKGVFLACQVFGNSMIEKKQGGSIINISSASAGPPLSKVFTYGISKAGTNNLTQFLAKEFAPHDIRVNAIRPGFFPAEQNRKILTEERVASIFNHTPMRRFGNADELVGVTVWLASNKAASFVTGAIVPVDGGYTAMTI